MSGTVGLISASHAVTPMIYGIAVIAQTASIYLTVFMTMHRFIGVCFPFSAERIITGYRVKLLLYGTLLLAFSFNVTKFLEIRTEYCLAYNVGRMIHRIRPTSIRYNTFYKIIFIGWIATIIKFLIPFTSLILMNGKIFQALRQSKRRHQSLRLTSDYSQGTDDQPRGTLYHRLRHRCELSNPHPSNQQSNVGETRHILQTSSFIDDGMQKTDGTSGRLFSKADNVDVPDGALNHRRFPKTSVRSRNQRWGPDQAKEFSTSVTLIGIVLVFLICNSLSLVVNMIEVTKNRERFLASFQLMVDISILLVAISCSINMFVYCLFSQKYRTLLRFYVCYIRHKSESGHPLSRASEIPLC